jgi:putative PIN family toxin of toxin-antitoxin system
MDLLHFADVKTQPLQAAIAGGEVRCFSDSECLAELERVVAYPQFGLGAEARSALIDDYRRFVTLLEATAEENYLLPRCRDADDQKFLILAARCRADLLITRDKLLLRLAGHRQRPPPCRIVTAETAGKLLALG